MDTAFVDETILHPFVVQPCAMCVCVYFFVRTFLKKLAIIRGKRLDSGLL